MKFSIFQLGFNPKADGLCATYPFAIVSSSEQFDNWLHLQMWFKLPHQNINEILVFDYENNQNTFVPDWNQAAAQTETIDGESLMRRYMRVRLDNVPYKCFYVVISYGSAIELGNEIVRAYYRTEIIHLYRFALEDPELLRIESDYPSYDCYTDELDSPDIPYLKNMPNYYNFGSDVFKNFRWFKGSIAFSENKTSWEYEGFFSEHTKTNFLKIYDLIFKELNTGEAAGLDNVLGGKTITIWRNNNKLSNEFKISDASVSRDPKYCALYGVRVKLIGNKRTIYFGC